MDIEELEWRFMYHPATTEEHMSLHAKVRELCLLLAKDLVLLTPEGREQSLAVTNLEQAMFWANAAIARSREVE